MFPPTDFETLSHITSRLASMPRCDVTLLVPWWRDKQFFIDLQRMAISCRPLRFAAYNGLCPSHWLQHRCQLALFRVKKEAASSIF